jgi:oligopeptide transport system substrate-binding protein
VSAAPAPQTLGNTLRLNVGSEPDTIDPGKASFVGEINVVMRVFSNLLRFDTDLNLIPDQAAEMPAIEDDGTRLTFRLRDDITYSDGKPVTAQDFEYGWKRQLDPNTAGEYAFAGYILVGAREYNTADAKQLTPEQLQGLRDAVGVRALDDKTLQFQLKAPAPYFLSVLATWNGLPVRQDMVEAGGETWTEPATYVGNGPYILTEWEHQSRIHFRANPHYYRGAPPIEDVEHAMIGESAVAFAAYLNDELDIVNVQAEDKPRVDGDPALRSQFHSFLSGCTYYIGFNNTKAPFDNQKVRAAFSLALDRSGYVRNILGGAGMPARQFLPPGYPGYYESDLAEQTFNPTAGQGLLAEAGFPQGKGLPQIKIGFSSNARNRTRIEALADIFKRGLGVDLQPDPMESRAYTAAVKRLETTPQMYQLAWCQDYPDPQDWYGTVFHSTATVSHTGWKNADFDRLVDQADLEPDPDRRREMYRQAAQILVDDVPVAFWYYGINWILVKPRVQGYRDDPNENFVGQHSLYDFKLAG